MNAKSVPATLALGTTGLLLLAALGWVGLISPALGDVNETNEARTQIQDANQAKRVELVRLRRAAEELPTTDALAADLAEMFPATADQPGFYAQVSAVAQDAGLDPEDVTGLTAEAPLVIGKDPAAAPAAPPAGGGAGDGAGDGTDEPAAAVTDTAMQGVTVVVRGDYAELTRVMRGLERMPRAFLVVSVDVSVADDEDDTMTLTVVGATFVAPPVRVETS